MRFYDTHTLRREGRNLSTPFGLKVTAGEETFELTCTQILRHLPGKRLVCFALWRHATPMVAKIFLDPSAAERHCRRERNGLQALRAARIPTPELRFEGRLTEGGAPLLATQKMEDFENLGKRLDAVDNDTERLAILQSVVTTIAQLHAAGLRQRDIHPGNFLLSDGTVMIIDGDDIEKTARAPLSPKESLANLALFCAQFPSHFDALAPRLGQVYAAGRNWPSPLFSDHAVQHEIQRWRAWRLKQFLPKTQRPCTAFLVQRTWRRFMACDREWYGTTSRRQLLDDPDAFIQSGTILKAGNSATIAKIPIDGQTIVVKRYNIKNTAHALKRALRPSRAMVSWRNAHRLRFLGINTPRPLAIIEERWGQLRQRAFFLMAYHPGETIDQALRAAKDDKPTIKHHLDQLSDLLEQLAAAGISHGDFKATNFLLSSDRLYLVDLDGMRVHRSAASFKRTFRRDLSRLLSNWDHLPHVRQQLFERLRDLMK